MESSIGMATCFKLLLTIVGAGAMATCTAASVQPPDHGRAPHGSASASSVVVLIQDASQENESAEADAGPDAFSTHAIAFEAGLRTLEEWEQIRKAFLGEMHDEQLTGEFIGRTSRVGLPEDQYLDERRIERAFASPTFAGVQLRRVECRDTLCQVRLSCTSRAAEKDARRLLFGSRPITLLADGTVVAPQGAEFQGDGELAFFVRRAARGNTAATSHDAGPPIPSMAQPGSDGSRVQEPSDETIAWMNQFLANDNRLEAQREKELLNHIQQAFAILALKGVRLDSAECRKTMCRVIATFPSHQVLSDAQGWLMGGGRESMLWRGGGFFPRYEEHPDGSISVWMYLGLPHVPHPPRGHGSDASAPRPPSKRPPRGWRGAGGEGG